MGKKKSAPSSPALVAEVNQAALQGGGAPGAPPRMPRHHQHAPAWGPPWRSARAPAPHEHPHQGARPALGEAHWRVPGGLRGIAPTRTRGSTHAPPALQPHQVPPAGDAATVTQLKENGSKLFAQKEYDKALECWDRALQMVSGASADAALLHSNKAACHMLSKK